VISPLPVALVEGRRRTQWCPPSTTDSLGARKAKILHQVNQVVAQSKIRRHPVDRFYARHFDLRRGRCRRFGRPHRRRLLRMCCKRPCRSHASKQADELASPHSITSSTRASRVGGISRPSALRGLELEHPLDADGAVEHAVVLTPTRRATSLAFNWDIDRFGGSRRRAISQARPL
jgi:hypothetical protein